MRAGQSGQRSMKRNACSLHGATMKSSRACADRTPKGKTSWPGISSPPAGLTPAQSHRIEPEHGIGKGRRDGDDRHDIGIGRHDLAERPTVRERSHMNSDIEK